MINFNVAVYLNVQSLITSRTIDVKELVKEAMGQDDAPCSLIYDEMIRRGIDSTYLDAFSESLRINEFVICNANDVSLDNYLTGEADENIIVVCVPCVFDEEEFCNSIAANDLPVEFNGWKRIDNDPLKCERHIGYTAEGKELHVRMEVKIITESDRQMFRLYTYIAVPYDSIFGPYMLADDAISEWHYDFDCKYKAIEKMMELMQQGSKLEQDCKWFIQCKQGSGVQTISDLEWFEDGPRKPKTVLVPSNLTGEEITNYLNDKYGSAPRAYKYLTTDGRLARYRIYDNPNSTAESEDKENTWIVAIGNSEINNVITELVKGNKAQVKTYLADLVKEDRDMGDEAQWVDGTERPADVEEREDGTLYADGKYKSYHIDYVARLVDKVKEISLSENSRYSLTA